MKKKYEKALAHARSLMIEQWTDFTHALACPSCGLRGEALALLHLVDWSEEQYLAELIRSRQEGRPGA